MRTKSRFNSCFVSFGLHIIGILLCVLPPAVCTLLYFPLWKESSEKTLAGGVVILLILSAYPLFKLMKKLLASPASVTVWLIIFVAFLLLAKIADEVTVISFWGLIGNAAGSLCFYLRKRMRRVPTK